MLANILLHEVLDAWFQDEVKPRLRGQGTLVRYADDAVMMFSTEADAKRVFDVLPKRFAKYGLTLHPEKKLVAFERPDRPYRTDRDDGPGPLRPGTFDFLGFRHPLGQGASMGSGWYRHEHPRALPAHAEGHRDVVPDASSPRHR
ncbi:MAG: hypothetical protein IPG04_05365 [Polyangiaceae bacterium]|nr:hypothetical protein [Polyangiaceae bacterium]